MYISVEQAVAYLSLNQDIDDEFIADLITSAQSEIEHICRRVFEAPADVTRLYSVEDLVGNPRASYHRYSYDGANDAFQVWGGWPVGAYSNANLDVGDDLLSVTTLVNGDGTIIPSSSYVLWPLNAVPASQIKLLSTVTPQTAWTLGLDQFISVTGRFAYSLSAPADIQLATKKLVSYHYHQRDNQNFDAVQLPDGSMQIPRGFPQDVLAILRRGNYIRPLGVI